MSNTYFKAMSVMGCEIGGITRRNVCRHNCCDGENCVTWLEKQFAKLNEYEEAKAEGRLVVLPCKVGDSIYRPEGLKYSVFWTIANVTIYPDEIVFTDDSDNIFTLDDIGKTVFLTREEAEKALGVGE
jgi:hypothetical protein